MLKIPYGGWEDTANRREQKMLKDHLPRYDQGSLSVMPKSAIPFTRSKDRPQPALPNRLEVDKKGYRKFCGERIHGIFF